MSPEFRPSHCAAADDAESQGVTQADRKMDRTKSDGNYLSVEASCNDDPVGEN